MTEAVAPKTVGVIGGGRMGAGIAQVFASLRGAVTIAESGDTAAALHGDPVSPRPAHVVVGDGDFDRAGHEDLVVGAGWDLPDGRGDRLRNPARG